MAPRLVRAFALALPMMAAAALDLALAADDLTIVARRIVYPGETIGADSLAEVKLRANNRVQGSIVVDHGQVEGKVARRTLLPGKPIPLSSIREPWLVEAGVPTVLAFVGGGLEISTMGVALQPGAAGDVIRVRNADTGAIVSGIVLADGTIRIGP